MTDLDNSDANEQLKFSILKRLPEVSFLLNCSLEICLMKSDPAPLLAQSCFCRCQNESCVKEKDVSMFVVVCWVTVCAWASVFPL